MTRLITAFTLAATVLAGVTSANAVPIYGSSVRDLATRSHISPHGVFDRF